MLQREICSHIRWFISLFDIARRTRKADHRCLLLEQKTKQKQNGFSMAKKNSLVLRIWLDRYSCTTPENHTFRPRPASACCLVFSDFAFAAWPGKLQSRNLQSETVLEDFRNDSHDSNHPFQAGGHLSDCCIYI